MNETLLRLLAAGAQSQPKTTDDRIDDEWTEAHDAFYSTIFSALDGPIEQFFREHAARSSSLSSSSSHSSSAKDVTRFYRSLRKDVNGVYPPAFPPADVSFPAIDIGSYDGVKSTAMALQWTPPFFPFGSIEMFPTDVEPVVVEMLRPVLHRQVERETTTATQITHCSREEMRLFAM